MKGLRMWMLATTGGDAQVAGCVAKNGQGWRITAPALAPATAEPRGVRRGPRGSTQVAHRQARLDGGVNDGR